MELADVAIHIGRSVAILAKKLRRKKNSSKTSKYKQLHNDRQGKKNILHKFIRDAANGQPIGGTFVNPFGKRGKLADDTVMTTKCDVSKYTLYKTADIESGLLAQDTVKMDSNTSNTRIMKITDGERVEDRLCITENEEIIAEITEYSQAEADLCFVASSHASQFSHEDYNRSEHSINFREDRMCDMLGGNSMSSGLGTREPGDGSDTPSRPHAVHKCPRRILYDNIAGNSSHTRRKATVCRSISARYEEPALTRRQSRRNDTPIFLPMHTRPTGSMNRKADDIFERQLPGRTYAQRRPGAFRRYPSLNTAFVQSENCSLEGSLAFTEADDTTICRSQDIDFTVTSSDEDSNVFEKAFVKYGVV